MIGSSKKIGPGSTLTIQIDMETLENTDSFTYLGITINTNLTWEDHIEKICLSVRRKLNLLKRLKQYLPLFSRLLFFNTLILPYFDYCDIIWGDRDNQSVLMNTLQVLQNNAARIILDMHPNSSATEALKRLSWKPLHQRKLFHRNIFMYKCMNNLLEHDFPLIINQEVHDHNTLSKGDIRKPRAKRRWGHWTCTAFASTEWNNIDFSIRIADTYLFLK